MALASVLVSGARLNSLRLTQRRLALVPSTPPWCFHLDKNARSFSSLLLQIKLTRRSWTVGELRSPVAATQRHITTPTAGQTAGIAKDTAALSDDAPLSEASTTLLHQIGTAAPDGTSASEILTPDFVDAALTHLPPALQYGDLAALGLVSWTPAGLIRWSFELLNVSTNLPWFWTIVAGSVFWKLVLFPLSVAGLRNSARLLPLQPEILKSQAEMKRIRDSGDKLALQRHALKMRKMYNDAGVNMGVSMLAPFVQIPVTLGMFFGVKTMCNLPVVQMMHSGLDILPDLTVPDPYMILPLALCVAVNLQISVGAAELNMKERPEMGHIMNGLRILSLLGVWVMSSFPSGLMISLITTSLATTVQSLALQHPPIRHALDIPMVPDDARGRLPSPLATVQYMIESYKRKVKEAGATAQQQRPKRR